MTRTRKWLAELVGTCFLLMAVVGSGIMAETLTSDMALALWANTAATAAMLYVLITMLGPLSGAHFNPAVSLIMALDGQLPKRELSPFVLAQLLGAVLGVWLAHLMFDQEMIQIGIKARTGPAQWLSEGIATFGLVLSILLSVRFAPKTVPMVVGLYIASAYWFTASTSFANPAVTFARSLTTSFSGIDPTHMPGFVLAQIAGGLLAWGLAKGLLAGSGK
jgi:glycerol uptake facilitator-like aquaporin